jgi:uroporphyrinogen decarboxylase
MNSRKTVLDALNHKETERVAVDFSGHRSSGIHAIAYARLRKYLGLPPRPIRVYDIVQQMAVVDEDVLRRFGVDTIELGRAFATEDRWWKEWILPDGTPCQIPSWVRIAREETRWVITSPHDQVIAQMPDGALYFEQTHFPFALGTPDHARIGEEMSESMWTGIASPPGPIVSGPQGEQLLIDRAKEFRRSSDRAILGLFGGNLLEMGQFLYRNDNFFMLLASEPARAHDFLDRVVEMHLKNLEAFLGRVGGAIDVIVFGDDLGMQSGPQISPAMYREFFKPRHARLWARAKELAGVRVMLHCCGGVRELLPDLIDAGLEAINPVQISCRGMDAAGLKRDFGRDITFWGGGCDTREVLSRGKPDEIAQHVRTQVDTMRRGGGFVFQQVHNIQSDVPPENIVAMFDAVRSAD